MNWMFWKSSRFKQTPYTIANLHTFSSWIAPTQNVDYRAQKDKKKHFLLRESFSYNQETHRHLKLDHLSLSFLVTTQFEMFASLQWNLFSKLAFAAFHSQDNLLCRLGFLVVNGSSLTTKTRLFPFVTTLSLGKCALFGSFILRHFMKRVLSAFGTFAKGLPGFWDVHHCADSVG